jgi:hypothetical protein
VPFYPAPTIGFGPFLPVARHRRGPLYARKGPSLLRVWTEAIAPIADLGATAA